MQAISDTTLERTDEVISALALIDDADQLLRVNDALRQAFDRAKRVAKAKFSVGDRVTFEGSRGQTITGAVTKVMQKNLRVKQDESYTTWTVSPTLCEIVGAA